MSVTCICQWWAKERNGLRSKYRNGIRVSIFICSLFYDSGLLRNVCLQEPRTLPWGSRYNVNNMRLCPNDSELCLSPSLRCASITAKKTDVIFKYLCRFDEVIGQGILLYRFLLLFPPLSTNLSLHVLSYPHDLVQLLPDFLLHNSSARLLMSACKAVP